MMPPGQPRVPMVPGRPYKYTGMAGATQVEHKVALCAESPKVLILVSKIGSAQNSIKCDALLNFAKPDRSIRLVAVITGRYNTLGWHLGIVQNKVSTPP